jgi:hypothetical protein
MRINGAALNCSLTKSARHWLVSPLEHFHATVGRMSHKQEELPGVSFVGCSACLS